MSTFVALNIELDEDSEEEIDDTKEIQIEEALKLYQNALKLHSQGPASYTEAAAAYAALFQSEIFRYPEAISEYRKLELQEYAPDHAALADGFITQTLPEANLTDGSPSSLPQIIYLAYKNHGQFMLDSVKHYLHNVSSGPEAADAAPALSTSISAPTGVALQYFAEALERDDTDLDLWRKAARIGGVLSSQRIIRFCLESVLAGDEDGSIESSELLGLDEAVALEDLRDVLRIIRDDLSKAQIPSSTTKRSILTMMRKRLDSCPDLPPAPKDLDYADPRKRPLGIQPIRQAIRPVAKTWAAIGQAIIRVLIDEQQSIINLGAGAAIAIDLPLDPGLAPAELETHHVELQASAEPALVDVQGQVSDQTISSGQRDENPQPEAAFEDTSSTDKVHQERGAARISESVMADVVPSPEELPEDPADPGMKIRAGPEASTMTLPTGKRSSASAGHDEPADGSRVKSKRIRARESNADAMVQDEEIATQMAQYYEDQLQVYAQADEWMFKTVGSLLSKLGVESLGTIESLKRLLDREDPGGHPTWAVISDLRHILNNWDDEKHQAALLHNSGIDLEGGFGAPKNSGLAIFLEHSKRNNRKSVTEESLTADEILTAFTLKINNGWFNLHDSALQWLEDLILPRCNVDLSTPFSASDGVSLQSTYTGKLWPDGLKEAVVQIIVREDEYIFRTFEELLLALEQRILHSESADVYRLSVGDSCHVEMAETLFELHLDIYEMITNPSSEVDQGTRILQRDRLDRWAEMAGSFVNHYVNHTNKQVSQDPLLLRYVWSATYHANMALDASQEHVLLCLQELKRVLKSAGDPIIVLQNNAAMPEISIAAVDQDMSRLSTMDFFMSVLDNDAGDPIAVIESLEPILDPSSIAIAIASEPINGQDEAHRDEQNKGSESALASAHSQELSNFLERGDASLKLFLWRRLREAYDAIDYQPKVVSCYLRSIEVIMSELFTAAHVESSPHQRQLTLLKWLKAMDFLIIKLLSKVLHDPSKALESIDQDHLQSSISAVAELSKVLHSFALYEDSVRVGQTAAPVPRTSSLAKSLESFKDKLREMQIRAWTLQYCLLKEGFEQNRELFERPVDDAADYLRTVHNAMGLRLYCKYSNKVFLKLMKVEFLSLATEENYDLEIEQLLFDMHGLRFSSNAAEVVNHGCPPEALDKKTASLMVDTVITQARRINIRDLGKTELKATIDKMQQAIGAPKSNPALTLNRRVLAAYLKSPVNSVDLYRSLKGVGELTTKRVQTESAAIANKGWYFLLGHMALARFKSVKRVNPTPTDDLDIAGVFFKQDLEHGTENWESWYRLAQVYDAKIEEDILWTADKINNHRPELATLQRNAMHCYSMAVATAIRSADNTKETIDKISDMYTEFAVRMYASSREPLSMAAFSLDSFQRHYSSGEGLGMYKSKPFGEMPIYSVWNFAAVLLNNAIESKPGKWINHYMLGKCLWKMFNSRDKVRVRVSPVEVENVIDAFVDAIESLPARKDNRSEPIFEPHFKLVSIVHKLVHGRFLQPSEGSEILQATPFARQEPRSEDLDSWEPYILNILKRIGNADKSNWHHRIIARAAHVIYDDQKDPASALGAKHEFTQQIFTKTMTLQVWKPEHERAGRHFVYTSRYVSFFVVLLNQLTDRASLDLLVRRIRKKPGDFQNHNRVWEEVCTTYVKVLRRVGRIPEGHDTTVFNAINYEEFSNYAARLEAWAHLPATSSSIIDILRDAIELKKLNNSLLKGTLIDDLIADAYAVLYETNVPQLAEQMTGEENRERMKVDHLLMTDGAADAPTPPASGSAPSDTGVVRHRAKYVSRRELQRKAEAVVNKPLAPKAPFKSIRPAGEQSQVMESVQIPLPIKDDLRDEAAGAGSSAAGSVHDSADDESELSEVDETKVMKPMFPNLAMTNSAESSKPSEAVSANPSVNGEATSSPPAVPSESKEITAAETES